MPDDDARLTLKYTGLLFFIDQDKQNGVESFIILYSTFFTLRP